MSERVYICIDLKSFYASVECIERGLDPFRDNLVVADPDRTEKTICLAITPAMKALGVRNRCRVFEIPPAIEYVKAKPRMRLYMQRSAEIYEIYLRYVSPDDVHVYSIDEVFIEATPYLALYKTDARSFARTLMNAVFSETGICATAGVGTNMFLAKVALDITAKHSPDNIGFLDEALFRERIWFHEPITDIWQIGPGIARRLAKYGVRNLAGVAAMDPAVLHREFGRNAEYLIDHAWGLEPCTIADVHAYTPEGRSMVNGQVLSCDYSFEDARMVMREMAEASVLELVEQGIVTERVHLMVGYARGALDAGRLVSGLDDGADDAPAEFFDGGHGKRAVGGRYGVRTGGSRKLDRRTNSRRYLLSKLEELFDETTLRDVPIRRVNIGFSDLLPEEAATLTLFDDVAADTREHELQDAINAVRGKFGKNAMLRLSSLQEKATARERNEQVGGHHA
ncbi:MAG: DNA repair protein [Eggerthellaceae bacterium]|nr:DNA repair protein [Eggerthellaceae bacterium]